MPPVEHHSELNVVTGACGYTGKYITRLLLEQGKRVKTLTGHPDRPNPFGDRVSVAPFNFDNIMHPELALFLSRLVGNLVGDVVLTRDEVEGLMDSLLTSEEPPLGQIHLGDWLDEQAHRVGTGYASELERHYH